MFLGKVVSIGHSVLWANKKLFRFLYKFIPSAVNSWHRTSEIMTKEGLAHSHAEKSCSAAAYLCTSYMNMKDNYRLRSEGYVFTGVCHSVTERGGEVLTRTRSQHLPPSLPPWDQPGDNTSLPPPPDQVTTPPPPPGLCAGGRYASYWNAFLFNWSSLR